MTAPWPRQRTAHLLRALRNTWLLTGKRGRWARFRMAWLMDKKLGVHCRVAAVLRRHVQEIAEGADHI